MTRPLLVVVGLALASVPAAAQTSVSVAGGVTVPLGDASRELKTGYNATIALNSKPPLASVGIRIEGMFNSLAVKDDGSGATAHRIMAATANATIANAETPLRTFYGIGGVGLYNSKRVAPSGPPDNNDIGFNIGLGMNFMTGVGAYVEARYHHVPSELATLRIFPVTFGLRF
jgi:hypothetical protein